MPCFTEVWCRLTSVMSALHTLAQKSTAACSDKILLSVNKLPLQIYDHAIFDNNVDKARKTLFREG